MTSDVTLIYGGPIFDGSVLHTGKTARFVDGMFEMLVDGPPDLSAATQVLDLGGDILSPGFVDLQVNGGGGVMLNDAPGAETIATIADAHRRLGTTSFLPTLISDTADQTQAAISATVDAIAQGVPGVLGLHLEGPHLSIVRKGAHSADMIRPMTDDDLQMLLAAANNLPLLKVTIAPENVSLAQVHSLAQAGVLVSLGHTDADYETCMSYSKAGATCATHLFNAMSQLGNRQPGLVGAVLDCGALSTGLIADAVHVHPASIKAAWAAKTGPGQIFLVSDAMAVAGSDMTEFTLNDRTILRRDGQLRLEDGTLAGADLDLVTAVSVLVQSCSVGLDVALAAATLVPAQLARKRDHNLHQSGLKLSEVICLSKDLKTATQIIAGESALAK